MNKCKIIKIGEIKEVDGELVASGWEFDGTSIENAVGLTIPFNGENRLAGYTAKELNEIYRKSKL